MDNELIILEKGIPDEYRYFLYGTQIKHIIENLRKNKMITIRTLNTVKNQNITFIGVTYKVTQKGERYRRYKRSLREL